MTKTSLFSSVALCAAVISAPAHGASITGLFNTGTDANNVALVGGNGLTDTHYSIVSSSSPGFAGQQAVTYKHPAYAAEDANSRWISLGSGGTPGSNTTLYRLSFDLTGLNASTASISGSWGADNRGTIFLNGVNTGITTTNFSSLTNFSIGSGFISGINNLDFRIEDFGPPTAFRVDNLVGTADLAGAVPEPAAWALFIAGFGVIGAGMRRRTTAVRFAAA